MATAAPVVPAPETLEQKFAKIEGTAGSAPTEVVPAPTPSATPEAAPTEQVPVETPEAEGAEPEVDLEAAPETSGDFAKYKPLFKENPELRQILGREKAFTEIQGDQPFSEFRQIHELIPTVEDAQRMVEESDNAREFGRSFRESPTEFVSSLKQSDPRAFKEVVSELPTILAKQDPQIWREQAGYYLDRVLNNAYQIAASRKDEQLTAAVTLVMQNLGITAGGNHFQSENPEVEQLKAKLAEKEQSDKDGAFQSFYEQTDSVITDGTVKAIEDKIKTLVPTATDSQVKRMVKETFDGTMEQLRNQPQFAAQLQNHWNNAKKGRMSIAEHNAIVNFATSRAKLVIPRVASAVVSEWNQSVFKTSKATTEKKQAVAATTKDVGAGPQATTSAAQGSAAPQYKKPEDVFKAIEAGTYVPPKSRVS